MSQVAASDAAESDVNEVEAPEVARNVVFAAPADDPRARRPADMATLLTSLLLTLLFVWIYRSQSDIDDRVRSFVSGELPGWLTGTATIVFILGGLYTVGLIVGIAFFGHGRAAVVRDMLVAAALAAVSLIGLAYLGSNEFPDFIPELLEREGNPSYPVGRLTIAVAVLSVAGPYLSLPMRRVGQRLTIAMALAALILTYGTLSGVLGGVTLGWATASAVHVLFGSGLGIPSRARIMSALADARLDVADIEYLEHQPIGATLVRAHLRGDDADLSDAEVKIYGRDAADAAFSSRLWRSIWYRDNDASVLEKSEHLAARESLALLSIERYGGPAPGLLAWSRTSTGDALVVTEWVHGRRLDELEADEVDDATLDRVWAALGQFNEARLAHGGIDRSRIVITDDRVVFDDYSNARIVANKDELTADRAQLLVVTAIAVGEDRAIEAARRKLGDAGTLDLLPLMQTAALPSELQKDAKAHGVKIGKLRGKVAETLDAEAPELVQIARVSWGHVAMTGLTLFAVYSLISALTDIGFDTIADQLSQATWEWVAVAFVLAQLTNVGEYMSLAGVMGKSIPFGPTIMFRYALNFVDLAVPGSAGEIAMNIQYQKKLGVPAAAALAQGPLLTVFSKGLDLILLLITARFVGQAVDLDEIDVGPVVQLLGFVILAVVIGIVVVFAVPKLRARVMPHIKEGLTAVKGAVTDPERLLKISAGTVIQKILFALTLSAAVAAYGSSITFGQAIFVNTAISLLVGLIPVPGGVGVSEAALTAGLTAVGVPPDQAIAAAITHRIVTSYLPPAFGYFASKWLTERDYL